MTASRYAANAPIFKHFSELASLPPAERRAELMLRLEHVWEEAQNKTYTTKKGEVVASPDGNLQLKVVQAVAEILDAPDRLEVEESDRLKLLALRSLCSDKAILSAVIAAGSLQPLLVRFVSEMASVDGEQQYAAALLAAGEGVEK